MAKLTGAFIAIEFERVDRFDWTDPKTGLSKPINNIVGLMANGDRTVSRIQISFPRDATYQVPSHLKAGEHYLFPVVTSVNKKRQDVQYTIRTDIQPIPSPEVP